MGLAAEDPAGTEQRFAIDPVWILRLAKVLKAEKRALVGFYHSHPDQPPVPSETDRKLLWPDVVHVICSLQSGRSEALRAWHLPEENGTFREVNVELVE